MRFLLIVLAVFGILAVLRRVLLAVLRLLGRGVDRIMANEMAEIRARRGDLTGLDEADVEHGRARRAQAGALAVLSFWVLLLIAPSLTPWPLALYASYSLLWVIPRLPVGRS